MTTEADFLTAIAANPHDEVAKLVFADWLEKRGDPRGAWLRVPWLREWLGPTLQSPIPAVVEALAKGRNVTGARRVCAEIGELVVPALIELLGHQKVRVRQQAARCLSKIGAAAAVSAVPALLAAL